MGGGHAVLTNLGARIARNLGTGHVGSGHVVWKNSWHVRHLDTGYFGGGHAVRTNLGTYATWALDISVAVTQSGQLLECTQSGLSAVRTQPFPLTMITILQAQCFYIEFYNLTILNC